MSSGRPRRPRRHKIRPRTIAFHLIGWSFGLLWLIPFLGVFMTAIRPQDEILQGWWNLSPFNPTLRNFQIAWSNPDFPMWLGLRNSFLIAIPATIIPMFVASLAAYGFARFHFRTRDYVFLTIVLLMAIPQQMVAVPIFLAMVQLGLIDNLLSVILLHSAWGIPWILLFMRNFLQTLPAEVEEAAHVDGASDFKIFFKIVLPISLPALAAVAVLQFMWVWNDFFFARILLLSPENIPAIPLVTVLGNLSQYLRDQGLLSAASVLALLVPVVVYAVLQRYWIRGMIGWTIKG